MPSIGTEDLPKKKIADEFSSWAMTPQQVEAAAQIRNQFDLLLDTIVSRTPPHNARYLAIVKTKLEEASFFAVKGIAKPDSKGPTLRGEPYGN